MLRSSLISLLVDRQLSLVSHMRKKYDDTGKPCFNDVNILVVLSDVLTDNLQDPVLEKVFI